MRFDGTGLTAIGMTAVAVCIVAAGTWRIVEMIADVVGRAPAIELGSGVFAIPLFGLALGALGILIGLPEMGGRHPRWSAGLFAAFLLFGAGTVATAITGPALMARLMTGAGYRGCERRIGVRAEHVRWVTAAVSCDTAVDFHS